jgi:DNA end-binding protein Ku
MVEPWEPKKYHDDYRKDLLHLIDERVKAGQTHLVETTAPEAPVRTAEVIDLMTQLKRSVEARQQGAVKPKEGEKAASSRTPRKPARKPSKKRA